MKIKINSNIHNFIKNFKKKEKKKFKIVGRITSIRNFKKIIFIKITNIKNTLQLVLRKNLISKINIKYFKLGDFIYVKGYKTITKSGEQSLDLSKIKMLKKNLLGLPNKFFKKIDKEYSYRNRHIDLVINSKSKTNFVTRFDFIKNIRKNLFKMKFTEVETPVLNTNYGGAEAKPFKTKNNFSKKINYLRISPELYLKRLIIGGFENIFEIGKNFRNESCSKKHNPEFTMLEFYSICKNYRGMMKLTEKLIKKSIFKTLKKKKIEFNKKKYNFSKKFKILTIKQIILKFNPDIEKNINNKDFFLNEIKRKPFRNNIQNLRYVYFDEKISKNILDPTFVIDLPIDYSPLALKKNKNTAERFELYIAGMEIANGFSELNDYKEQKKRFEIQKLKYKNDIDETYIEALKFGLPFTGGCGIGIDRLVMIITNSLNIRDVILYPFLK